MRVCVHMFLTATGDTWWGIDIGTGTGMVDMAWHGHPVVPCGTLWLFSGGGLYSLCSLRSSWLLLVGMYMYVRICM